jgi:hypothetical protein
MQLKNRFIAKAGVTIVLVMITAKAATMVMMVSDLWAGLMIITVMSYDAG